MRLPDCNERFDFSNSQVLLPNARQSHIYNQFNGDSIYFTPHKFDNPILNNVRPIQFEFVAMQVKKFDTSFEYQCD